MAPTTFPFDLVMFDLDGTLVATSGELADALNDTLLHLGLDAVAQEQVDRWIGHGAVALLAQALAVQQGRTPELVREDPVFATYAAVMGGFYEQRCGTRSHLCFGVERTLKGLKACGVRLAVLTNKEARYTQRVLDAHGLTPWFGQVVAGDTLPVRKPDPAVVWACLKTHGVAANQALLVGDSDTDVLTARNAGVAVWAVLGGYNAGRSVAESQPDRVLTDLSAMWV